MANNDDITVTPEGAEVGTTDVPASLPTQLVVSGTLDATNTILVQGNGACGGSLG